MRERPLLLPGPLVRAVLDGTKTQLRQLVKPAPDEVVDGVPVVFVKGDDEVRIIRAPYAVGDRLWVRETWAVICSKGTRKPEQILYEADGDLPEGTRPRWQPSIHMPRERSRLTLEITYARMDRLQSITEKDAQAEGVVDPGTPRARKTFAEHWDKLHGARAATTWAADPYVWAFTFRIAS